MKLGADNSACVDQLVKLISAVTEGMFIVSNTCYTTLAPTIKKSRPLMLFNVLFFSGV